MKNMKVLQTSLYKQAQNFNKEKVIFVDLDGVVADWVAKAAETFDLDLEDEELRQKTIDLHDLPKAAGIKAKVFWDKVDSMGPEWWESIDVLPWGNKLYNTLKDRYGSVCFLTAPSSNPNSVHGKFKWIKKHFDGTKDFLLGSQKHFCAHKNAYLVDDSEKKIKKFKEAGGNAFLWPSCLALKSEQIDVDETIGKLLEYIDGSTTPG